MGYILENKNEGARLAQQSTYDCYDVAAELSGIIFPGNEKILDAGCGAGAITNYLFENFGNNKFYACDASELRVRDMQNKYRGFKNVESLQTDLSCTAFSDGIFDKIICRFVLQHIPNPENIFSEFKRILKPGGELVIIEADGFIFDLVTSNRQLNDWMSCIRESIPVNLYMGRVCPSLMTNSGFRHIDWDIRPMMFKGKELDHEYSLMEQRFQFVKKSLVEILGDESVYDEFCQLYLHEMMVPGNILFSNKFIVSAKK